MTNDSKNSKLKVMAFLQNVDDSITALELKHNLSVGSLSDEEAYNLFWNLEHWDQRETMDRLFMANSVLNSKTKKVYFIETEIDEGPKDKSIDTFAKFQKKVIIPYLGPLLTALRLFNRGDIAYWKSYFFNPDDPGGGNTSRGSILQVSGCKMYTLLPREMGDCNNFINTFRFPKEKYLDLAIEHFNNSYILPNQEASFLSLMISLEALFSKQIQELNFRVARNCAIFLSDDYDEGTKIFSDLKDIQGKRNKLIHGKGKKGHITSEDINLLREYVRCSLRKFLGIKENHDKLLNRLDTLGFGQF